MKFRPLHDRVVVRRIEENTKTAGGIIIPDTAKEKPSQGEVIAVGPGGRAPGVDAGQKPGGSPEGLTPRFSRRTDGLRPQGAISLPGR